MSVTLTASRSVDDRRRRRLAVSGDATGLEGESPDRASLRAAHRDRSADWPSASPWLPAQAWKQAAIVGCFWLALIGLAVVVQQTTVLPAAVARIITPLVTGASPRLTRTVELALWLLIAELSALVGWYRSHSQSDFAGRYRLWGWVAMAALSAAVLTGTDLHLLMGEAVMDRLPWLQWRRDILVWLAPLTIVGLVTSWLATRDMRRCRSAFWLLRLSICLSLATAGGVLFAEELSCAAWYPWCTFGLRWASLGLLVTALWRQAWFVAYVCPDPPERSRRTTAHGFRRFRNWLGRRWWKSTAEVASEPDPVLKKSRRKKTADAATEEGEETPTPKRKRKSPTAGTRTRSSTAKPRRKSKAVEASEEEAVADTDADSSWDSESVTDTATADMPESDTSSAWSEDEELAALERMTRPDADSRASAAKSTESTKSSSRSNDIAEDNEDYGGVDDQHSQGDMYKGLSKRQRRDLKKQQRETQRQ